MDIFREFTFTASSWPLLRDSSTETMNSYRVFVLVSGEVNPKTGWIIDLGQFYTTVKPTIEELNNSCLNNKLWLASPTLENIVVWIWDRLHSAFKDLGCALVSVNVDRLSDLGTVGVAYRGPQVSA